MKKILLGLLSTLIVIATTTIIVRAAFLSKGSVQGVQFSSGNADLKIYNGTSWETNWAPSDFIFTDLYPGYETFKMLYLKNFSTSDVTLKVHGQILGGASGDWEALKNVVWVNIKIDDTTETGYHSLSDWFSSGFDLPGDLSPGEQNNYKFYVKLDPSSGDEIANKSLTNVTFEFTGMQI